jgi:hypothetical protein
MESMKIVPLYIVYEGLMCYNYIHINMRLI